MVQVLHLVDGRLGTVAPAPYGASGARVHPVLRLRKAHVPIRPHSLHPILGSEGTMADPLAEDHKSIWLQPLCCVDERAWCSTDPGPCEDCGMPSIKYERADVRQFTVTPRGEAMSNEGAIPLVDSNELSRKIASQPWPIIKAIQTIQAHCVCIADEGPTEKVRDLAACISINCMEIADALADQQATPAATGETK